MRIPRAACLLFLLMALFLAPSEPSLVAAQQLTPEPARIDINIREIAFVEGQPDVDPLQVISFSRNNLVVADGYAYIASGKAGVHVVDVHNPFSPRHTAWVTHDSGNQALTVAVADRHLYVGQQNSLSIYDTSNPTAPVETGFSGMTGYPGLVSANQELVVLTMGKKLAVYRAGATDPDQPVAIHALPDYAEGVVLDQTRNIAVATYDQGKAVVIDLSTPETPKTLSQTNGPLGAGSHVAGLYSEDGRLHAAYFTWLRAYDLEADGSLTPAGGHGTDQSGAGYQTTANAMGIDVAGGLAYVADYRNGLYIIDVQDPQAMHVRGYSYPGVMWWALDAEADNDFVYVSSPQGALRVYQISGPGINAVPSPTGTPLPEPGAEPQPLSDLDRLEDQIVFLSSRDYQGLPSNMPYTLRPHDVYAMNADGSGQRRITSDLRLTNMSAPAVAPDGKQIAIGDRGADTEVKLLSPSGAVEGSLLVNRKDVRTGNWGPNGLLLTAWGEKSGPNQIMMHVESNGYLDLTQDTQNNGYGALSPDGKTVAFQNGPDSAVEHLQLWLMDVNGENKRLLLDRNAFDVAWSPDGKQIAFESYTDPATSASSFDIWVVNADGTNARNLTQGRFVRHYGPTWSPDGKRLAFAASPDGSERELQIIVMMVATEETTQLTNQGNNFEPYWAAGAPLPIPSGDTGIGPDLLDKKQASIERLSKLPIKFLYDLATYESDLGYDEQRAQDALDFVRKAYEEDTLSTERASAFYRLTLQEEAQEKLYELAMQSTTDMADSTLSIATLALSAVDALSRATKPLIDQGGFYGDIWLKMNQFLAARFMEFAEYPIQRFIESEVPEYWDRDKIQSAREIAFDSINLRIREGGAPGDILTDAAIRGPFAAVLLKLFVAQTQAPINDATAQVFDPDPTVVRGSDAQARVYAFGISGDTGLVYEARHRTELTHGLYEDFDLALDRSKAIAAIVDIGTLNPATAGWSGALASLARVLGAASGACGVWEGLTNADFLIDWSRETHRYIYNPEGAWSLDEHPIETGGCSNLWISLASQGSRAMGLSAPLPSQTVPPTPDDALRIALDAVSLASRFDDTEPIARAVDHLITVDEANLAAMRAHTASLPAADRQDVDRVRLAYEADMLALYAYAMGLLAGSEDIEIRDGLTAQVKQAERSLAQYREVVRSRVGSLPAVIAAPVVAPGPDVDAAAEDVAAEPESESLPATTAGSTVGLPDSVPLIAAIVLGAASALSVLVLLMRRRAAP